MNPKKRSSFQKKWSLLLAILFLGFSLFACGTGGVGKESESGSPVDGSVFSLGGSGLTPPNLPPGEAQVNAGTDFDPPPGTARSLEFTMWTRTSPENKVRYCSSICDGFQFKDYLNGIISYTELRGCQFNDCTLEANPRIFCDIRDAVNRFRCSFSTKTEPGSVCDIISDLNRSIDCSPVISPAPLP